MHVNEMSLSHDAGGVASDGGPSEPMLLLCEECKRVWLPDERDGWRCYLDDKDNLALYCPKRAEREFGDD